MGYRTNLLFTKIVSYKLNPPQGKQPSPVRVSESTYQKSVLIYVYPCFFLIQYDLVVSKIII